MSSHPDFGPVLDWAAEPEVRLRFDHLRGEPRNTDLLVKASDAYGDVVIAVEGKADESFGETVSQAKKAADARLLKNSKSGGLTRISELVSLLFGTTLDSEPSLGLLRYQLLTATAGALAASRNSGNGRAILLVQEFRTSVTDDRRHARNAAELNALVNRISKGQVTEIRSGKLYGPIAFGRASDSGPLYIGKVVHDLR